MWPEDDLVFTCQICTVVVLISFLLLSQNSTHCPPLLSHQEQRIVDILNRIATISCGSFGIVQMTTEAAACPAGCKVWSVSCPKPLLDVSANPVHRFFVHLSMNSENQLYLRSSDSTTYLNLPREHQPVLLSRTLQLNKCPHEPGEFPSIVLVYHIKWMPVK